MAFDFYIQSKQDLINAVQTFGFVPLFENEIEGFSAEEHLDPAYWFPDEGEGIWDWKGPVIREAGCAYGKFFGGKAVFISRKWFPDFANYRRDGYDFDARFDDELASFREKELFDLLDENAPITSKALKAKGDYRKGGKKGFDTLITHLQAQGYVLISDFVYAKDKLGQQYGWGIAEYTTPEKFFGPSFRKNVYNREPEESFERMFKHLRKLLPDADEKAIRRVLK